jgi:adenosine deaminase
MLLGAQRLGHGTQPLKDPVALEFAATRQLPVEANLVSNVRLGYARSYAEHPFLDLLRLGLRVSLSTDDEGILGTDISNEFNAAISHTNITYSEVRQLVLNSIDTCFAADGEKAALRDRAEVELREFEEAWRTHAKADADSTPHRQP